MTHTQQLPRNLPKKLSQSCSVVQRGEFPLAPFGMRPHLSHQTFAKPAHSMQWLTSMFFCSFCFCFFYDFWVDTGHQTPVPHDFFPFVVKPHCAWSTHFVLYTQPPVASHRATFHLTTFATGSALVWNTYGTVGYVCHPASKSNRMSKKSKSVQEPSVHQLSP